MRGPVRWLSWIWSRVGDVSNLAWIFPNAWLTAVSAMPVVLVGVVGYINNISPILWVPIAIVSACFAMILAHLCLNFCERREIKEKSRLSVATSPLKIIFDPKNALNRFWSLEAIYIKNRDGKKIYQGHNWEYRVLVRNVSPKTVKNVEASIETMGADPHRPQQTCFDVSKDKYATLKPGQEKFVILRRWTNPPILAGMMVGDAYGPIKITITGDDVLATSKTFHFNPEHTPMVSELESTGESL